MVYVDNDPDNQIITSADFNINIKTDIPVLTVKNDDEKTDPNYHVEDINTAEKSLESWKKGQRHLEQFWELWKNHYLLNLREKRQLFNIHPRVQSLKEPRIRDIVQVKNSSPRGKWRVGRVIEMTESQDGKERAAKVMMPNKIILQRSIIHLYPLECNDEEQLNEKPSKINLKVNRNEEDLKNNELRTKMNQGDKDKHRPKRAAAVEAGNKILD